MGLSSRAKGVMGSRTSAPGPAWPHILGSELFCWANSSTPTLSLCASVTIRVELLSKPHAFRKREASCPARGKSELCVCWPQGAGSDAKWNTDTEGVGEERTGVQKEERKSIQVLGASPPLLGPLSKEGRQMEKWRLRKVAP